MELEFDDGTLLLRGATESVPYGEWDDRVDEYRAQAYRYRALLEWGGVWEMTRDQHQSGPTQRTLEQEFDQTIEDSARAYPDLELTAITVTTYDSAYRYVNEYGDRFGLLVVDEEHHLPAPTYRQIPEMMIAPYRLGLTATYERPDGKHELLEDLLGPVVYREDVDELAGEYLSEYETIHMSVDLTADERSEYDEEYQIYRDYVDSHEFDLWKEDGYVEFLKRTSYDPQGRRALIAKQRAERIARTAEKKLDTNDFAYDISQEFIVPCITHRTKTDERTEILERFRSGEYSMLVTSQVLDEGIDVPAANVGIILSGAPRNASMRSDSADGPSRGYEAVLDGPASLFSKSQKYGIRMANFLPALPLCDRWEMVVEILVDEIDQFEEPGVTTTAEYR